MKRIGLCIAILVFAVISASFKVSADSDIEDDISAYVEEFRDKTKCKNVSIVICDAGRVSFYGDSEGLYRIGSMTKAFTGLGIRKLISENRLSEQTRIDEILPGFTAYHDSVPVSITIEQLLCQTSGYTNSEKRYPAGKPGMTLKDWVSGISGKELEYMPGERYAYSNTAYNLLGAVIEAVSGVSYKEYMENNILRPLGLTDTYVGTPEDLSGIIPGGRLGYRTSFDYSVPVAESAVPAGYFYSNASDMGRWIGIWLGNADIPDEYRKMIDQVKEQLTGTGDYYSGWERFDEEVTGHSGGTPEYSSRIIFSEEKDLGVCVLSGINAAASTDSLCNGLFAMVSGDRADKIKDDVWSVFDRIFTLVSIAAILLIPFGIFTRSFRVRTISGIFTGVLFIALCIVLPLVFGSGLGEILFVWAPYSLPGGMMLLLFDTVLFGILASRTKICRLKKDRLRTGR